MHYHVEFTCKRDITLADPRRKIGCSWGHKNRIGRLRHIGLGFSQVYSNIIQLRQKFTMDFTYIVIVIVLFLLDKGHEAKNLQKEGLFLSDRKVRDKYNT